MRRGGISSSERSEPGDLVVDAGRLGMRKRWVDERPERRTGRDEMNTKKDYSITAGRRSAVGGVGFDTLQDHFFSTEIEIAHIGVSWPLYSEQCAMGWPYIVVATAQSPK